MVLSRDIYMKQKNGTSNIYQHYFNNIYLVYTSTCGTTVFFSLYYYCDLQNLAVHLFDVAGGVKKRRKISSKTTCTCRDTQKSFNM